MRVIGVDPGLYGAVAVVDSDGGAWVWDIPVTGGAKRMVDISAICEVFDDISYDVDKAVIERRSEFPSKGGVSFALGHMVGVIEGYFYLGYIPYDYVAPKVWKRYYGIVGGDNKTSYEIASKYYPHVELMTSRGKILDSRCDALLLARWGLMHV